MCVGSPPASFRHLAPPTPNNNTKQQHQTPPTTTNSGKDLYVEATKEYDPLAPHRPRDASHNKGEGLGFMFSCFPCFGAPAADDEHAATAERHYSLPPSESANNLPGKAQQSS